MKRTWYLTTWMLVIGASLIALLSHAAPNLSIFWLAATLFGGAAFCVMQRGDDKRLAQAHAQLLEQSQSINNANETLRKLSEQREAEARVANEAASLATAQYHQAKAAFDQRINEYETYLTHTGYYDYDQMRDKLKELKNQQVELEREHVVKMNRNAELERIAHAKYTETVELYHKTEDAHARETKRLAKIKEIYKSVKNCVDNWLLYDPRVEKCTMPKATFDEVDMLAPSSEAKLHSMDVKDLRRAFRENERHMEALFTQYETNYKTKANSTIFALIVIALRSELQTILLNLRHEKTEKANTDVDKALQRAVTIASEGNQNILPTLTKFIGQLEHHFREAVKIEHLWYVRKEQQRQEQIALRERMKEEAAARKAVEEAQKRIAEEEAKYQAEIARLQELAATAEPEAQAEAQARLAEVQAQMAEVVVKKDEIAALAKGKAGTVYIISNLGSFGENVFKIGMTRRFDPQERIDELGTASVPFEFDVHSFIFSQDAVELENKLHERMWRSRLNKVNPHKEFFTTNIDALERLVQEIEPTAEFNRTMAAEDFRASQENIQLGEVQSSAESGDEDTEGENEG